MIVQKALEFIASRTGERFCQDNIRLDAARSQAHPRLPGYPVNFAELHPDLASESCYRMVFNMVVHQQPWARSTVEFFVGAQGQLLPDLPVIGVPECVRAPARCQFPVDSAAAIGLARDAGLEPGVRPWQASFGWQQSSLADPVAGVYVWRVSNTLSVSEAEDRGDVIVVDASSGKALQHMGWGVSRIHDGP